MMTLLRNMSPFSFNLVTIDDHFSTMVSSVKGNFDIRLCVCPGGEIDGIYNSLWEPVTIFFGKCLRFSTENLQLVYPKDLGHHKLQ